MDETDLGGINLDGFGLSWADLLAPKPKQWPQPTDWPVTPMSYGGGDLARFTVRRRKKRLAKKVARRGYFRRHNALARHCAWREFRQAQGLIKVRVWEPMVRLGEFNA